MPVAMVPRPWDFPSPPLMASNGEASDHAVPSIRTSPRPSRPSSSRPALDYIPPPVIPALVINTPNGTATPLSV